MDDQPNWFLAQGLVDGRPIFVRARDPSQLKVVPTRKFLLVGSLNYPIADERQLPSDDAYEKIEAFEADVFQASDNDAELVIVETASGVIRYFAYTSDPNQALAAIKRSAPFDLVDWDSAEDPEWRIYRSRIADIGGEWALEAR